jgi:hypothetical protein
MSILVCEVLPEGLVLAADKNVTITRSDDHGRILSEVQDVGSKILRWPKSRALIGSVGCGQIGSRRIYDWLYDFIGDYVDFTDPAVVANALRDRLQYELGASAPSTIVQFAAFTRRDGYLVPEYWHVTNVHGLTNGE